ncbi:MAG TPA: hypothetical protein VII47_13905 [Actinomycetota bacterium]
MSRNLQGRRDRKGVHDRPRPSSLLLCAVVVGLATTLLVGAAARADVSGGISLLGPDGSGLTTVTAAVAAESLDWSPDGTRIAFENYAGGNADVFVVRTDGSGLTRLTNDPGDDLHSRWVDNHRLTFDRRAEDGGTDVYLISDQGWRPELLLHLPGHNPEWSPDRSTIAFSKDEGAGSHVYTMRADGSGLARLTDGPGHDDHPVWSPDGTRIAFDRSTGLGTQIHVMDAQGLGQIQLTHAGFFNGLPDWSPDGTRLTFYGTGDDGDADVYVMHANGSALTNLTHDPGAAEGGPVWSPSGTRIAFVRDPH